MLIDRILRQGDSAQARVMMGVAKRGAGDMNGAVDDLKRAVELDPELPGVHGLYAQALLEIRQSGSGAARVRGRAVAQPARLRRQPQPRSCCSRTNRTTTVRSPT